jgi:hypothetical protein
MWRPLRPLSLLLSVWVSLRPTPWHEETSIELPHQPLLLRREFDS